MADDLRSKLILELDDRLTSSARRALGGFSREVDDVSRKAGRANDSLSRFGRGFGDMGRDAGRARAGIRNLSGDVAKLNKDLERSKKGGGSLIGGVALGNLAAGAVTKGFGAAVGAIDTSIDSARDFQKAMVDVAKVARGADDTAEGFARIEAGVKATARDLGTMPQEVAELTAALAPAFSGNIEDGLAVDIAGLSRDVTKIAVAWDVSGESAGKFFADTARGLGYTTTQTKDLFGSINELGNQLGVKSKDIAEAMTRSSGVLGTAGISGETGAAINATLLAAGATPEIAGTGVRTLLTRLGVGSAATKSQQHAFRQLKLNPVQVAKNMAAGGETAEKQLLKIIDLLNKLPKHKQLSVLSEMFGTESIGSIGAATRAVEALDKAFGIAGDKTKRAASIQAEYDRVAGTSSAKAQMLKAHISLLAIEFGNALLPYIDKAVEFLTSPEGQKWGEDAVKSAATAVAGLAKFLKQAVDLFTAISEKVSASDLALIALGGTALKYGPKLVSLFSGMRGEKEGPSLDDYTDPFGSKKKRGRGGGIKDVLGLDDGAKKRGGASGRGVTATGLAAAIPIIGYAAYKASEAMNEASTYDPEDIAREGLAGVMRKRQVEEQRMQLGALSNEDAERLQGMGGPVGSIAARLRAGAQHDQAVRFAEAAHAMRSAEAQAANALGSRMSSAEPSRGEVLVRVADERVSADSVINESAAFDLRVARGAA